MIEVICQTLDNLTACSISISSVFIFYFFLLFVCVHVFFHVNGAFIGCIYFEINYM